MTGKTATSWSWLHNIGIAALLVVAEATWVSLLIDASADTSAGPHVDLPFLALAVPAVLAATAVGWTRRTRWRWWRQVLILVPVVLVGVSLTAATVGVLTRGSGSWWQMATEPWSVHGHTAAVVAGLTWFVAALAWGRGAWLGAVPPSFRVTVWSLGLGAMAFLGMFLGRADGHAVAFKAATGGAGWLLFVWFPLAAAVVALVRERELEKAALSQARSRPGALWLTVLALPMLGVTVIALALAVLIGPGAPIAGHAVARVATAVWAGVATSARWLWDLLPFRHSHPESLHRPIASKPPPGPSSLPKTAHALSGPVIAVEVVAALILVAAIVYAIRHFRPLRVRWHRPATAITDEVRDSIFSWRHVGRQVWGALMTWWRRLRRRQHRRSRPDSPPALVDVGPGPLTAESVRQAYRRMLRAARAAGHGRHASETTRELQGRLALELTGGAPHDLDTLTRLYDAARYGESDPITSASDEATTCADRVKDGLAPVKT